MACVARRKKDKGTPPRRQETGPAAASGRDARPLQTKPFAKALAGVTPARRATVDEGAAAPAAPAAAPSRRARVAEAEDRIALRQAMEGVRPLSATAQAKRGRKGVARASRVSVAPSEEDELARARLAGLVGGGMRFQVCVDEDGRVEGRRIDAHRKQIESLATTSPRARLDLHGMSANEAERAVVRFVREQRRAGERVVAVVHGKGKHSEGGLGVLQDRVLHALTKGGAGPFVLAFASAPPRLGGTGALLVRLGDRK